MTKYTIEVEEDLWEQFKRIVTRDKTMNEAINDLIQTAVESRRTPPKELGK